MSENNGINAALLNFCMSADDGPRNGTASALPHRTAEEREWLRQAIAAAELPDQGLKRVLAALRDPATGPDVVLDALDNLQEQVEDINMAKEFALMKGPALVLDSLKTAKIAGCAASTVPFTAEIRQLFFLVVAHCVQNDVDSQGAFLELDWPAVFVPLLAIETDAGARAAAVLAVSGLCRGHAGSGAAFVNAGGFDALKRAMDAATVAGDATSLSRALRLCTFFASEGIAWSGLDRTCAALCSHEHEQVATSAMHCLWALVEKCEKQRPDAGAVSGALKVDRAFAREKLSTPAAAWRALPAADREAAHDGLLTWLEGKSQGSA